MEICGGVQRVAVEGGSTFVSFAYIHVDMNPHAHTHAHAHVQRLWYTKDNLVRGAYLQVVLAETSIPVPKQRMQQADF